MRKLKKRKLKKIASKIFFLVNCDLKQQKLKYKNTMEQPPRYSSPQCGSEILSQKGYYIRRVETCISLFEDKFSNCKHMFHGKFCDTTTVHKIKTPQKTLMREGHSGTNSLAGSKGPSCHISDPPHNPFFLILFFNLFIFVAMIKFIS